MSYMDIALEVCLLKAYLSVTANETLVLMLHRKIGNGNTT